MPFPAIKPGEKLTADQLLKLEDQVRKNSERIAELQKIGTSPETPDEGALMTHSTRAMSGFGEDEAIMKMTQAGYTDMHRNKAGDWVAKGPDDRWYSDSHGPVAFVERHLGDVPGLLGMAAGGAAGTVAGATAGAAAGSPGGIPGMAAGAASYAPYGAVAGAGAGAAGGEALRQYIGQKLGVRNADLNPSDIAIEGGLGAAGEGVAHGVGYGLSKIPVAGTNARDLLKQIVDKYGVQPMKRGVSRVAGALSGAGTDAAERTLERPAEMLAAGKNIDAKAAKAGDYLNFQDQVYGIDSSQARQGLQENLGDKVVDTSKLLERNADAMKRYAPNAEGHGPLSAEEWDALNKMQRSGYATEIKTPIFERQVEQQPQWKNSFQVSPQVEMTPVESRLKYGAKGEPQTLKDPIYGTARRDLDPVQLQTIQESLSPTLAKGETEVIQPEVRANPLNMRWARTGEVSSHLPEKSLGSLQRTADELAKDVGPANWKRAVEDKPAQRTKSFTAEAAKQYHDVKEILHMEDSNLARADKQYSEFARNAEPVANLASPLKREKEYNAITKAIAEGTDVEKVASAGRALPGHMDDLLDTGASKRFKGLGEGWNPLKPSPRRLVQLGLGAGSYSVGNTNPEAEYGLAAGALLLEPQLIKHLLARGAITAPAAAEAAARAAKLQGARSVWSLFNQEKQDGQ